MRLIVRHIRFNGLQWWILPLAVADLAILFLRTRYWIGVWPEAGAAAQVPALILGVAASGLAAWISGSRARHRVEEQLTATPRHPALLEFYRFSAVLFTFAIPYACGVIAAWAFTVVHNPPGMAQFFAYALAGAVALWLACGFGWLVGRLFAGRFATIIAILAWVIVGFNFGPSIGLSFVSGHVYTDVNFGSLALRWAAGILFLGSLLFLPLRIRRKVPIPVLASLMTAALAAAVIANYPMVHDRKAPKTETCTTGSIELCYWPEEAKYVPMMREVSLRASKLPDVFKLPERAHEYGLKMERIQIGSKVVEQATGDFSILEGNRWSLASSLAAAISHQTFPPACDWSAAEANNDYTADTLQHWVEITLAGGGTPEYRLGNGGSSGFYEARQQAEDIAKHKTQSAQDAWAAKTAEKFDERYCR
ncbi:hypothetical protein [Streptomyces sp. NPDC050121]|uniref:hypothetical protein n=1 Tax=Streptomyces sp. NPDC050121 TaxID=3365601 RepID=UPI0037B0E4F7